MESGSEFDRQHSKWTLEAAAAGDVEAVRVLLAAWPALVQGRTALGETLLHVAATFGHKAILNEVLALWPESALASDYENGETAIQAATRSGQLEIIDTLLDKDPNLLEVVNKNGENLVQTAVEEDQLRAVKHLLRRNPNLAHQRNHNGENALHVAYQSDRAGIANYLASKFPELEDMTDAEGRRPSEYRELRDADSRRDSKWSNRIGHNGGSTKSR